MTTSVPLLPGGLIEDGVLRRDFAFLPVDGRLELALADALDMHGIHLSTGSACGSFSSARAFLAPRRSSSGVSPIAASHAFTAAP